MSDAAQEIADIPDSLAQIIDDTKDLVVDDKPKADEPKPAKLEEEAKPDPLTEKARSSGWRPKEEFEGDPDEWVDAGEFVRRKPLFDQIHSLKKQAKDSEQKQKALTEFAAKASERGRQEALAQIEQEKQTAFEAGNYTEFNAAVKREQEINAQHQAPAQVDEPAIPQEVADFSKRNERWFEKDEAMTVYALSQARKYIEGKGMTRPEALKLVEADVKREFAHKFVNPNKEKAAAVVAENGDKRAAGKLTYNDLSREERSVWKSLQSHMSFDEFIKDLRS